MNARLFGMVVFAAFFLTAGLASANIVTLVSASGGLTVSGTLLAYDGKTYQVETVHGRITIADNDLTCRGAGCPSPQDRVDVFSVLPSDRISRETLMSLLISFATDSKKIYVQKGPFSKPDAIELSHRTDGLESVVAFKPDAINLSFDTTPPGAAIGFDAVQIIGKASYLNGRIDAKTLRGIWDGSITNWSTLGGPDADIRLILPIFTDDLYRTLTRFDPKLSPQTLTDRVEFFLSRDAITQAVNKDSNAIGLIYQARPTDITLGIQTACGITNAPSTFSIQSMEYPLAFQINLAGDQDIMPKSATDLQSYVSTPSAQRLFAQVGIVPLVGSKIDSTNKGKRFAEAIATADRDISLSSLKSFTDFASNATRLATTLYFAPNGRDLDDRSTKLVAPLAAFLKTSAYADKQIMAVGYSDSKGGPKANLTTSKRRAQSVQAALSALDVNVEARGFGEVAPIGCNNTAFGKSQNRRVEFWITN